MSATTTVSARLATSGADALADAFRRAADDRRAALVAFLAAGDPEVDASVELAVAAAHAGADVIELGRPYADSLADGPVIQAAYARAFASGIDADGVFEVAARIAARVSAPIVLMTAYNPVHARGVARFVRDAAEAGIAGLIVPDLPFEEIEELRDAARDAGLGLALLVAPDTSAERARRIAAASTGFVYLVRRRGVTGAGGESAATRERIDALRAAGAPPIAVGFGIATPADAAREGAHADGVIVGSALVDAASRAVRGEAVIGIERSVRAYAQALRAGGTMNDAGDPR